ncbi:MAG: lipopolysaccharide kinase InaA family protein [Methylophagaceae bacterium]
MSQNRIQLEQFLQGQEKLSLPFNLTIDGNIYACTQVLRLLPAKRLVVKAQNSHQQLVIKIFALAKKGERELARELRGYQLATQSEVNVPELVFTIDELAGCCAIAYHYIDNAKPFANDKKTLGKHVEALLTLVATLHNYGIYQADFHLENILISDDCLSLIDLASMEVESLNESLSKQKSLANLAMLAVQFQPKQQQLIVDHLQQYYQLRNWQFDSAEQDKCNAYISKAWQKRKTIYLNKLFRHCTMTAYHKTFTQQYGFCRSFYKLVGDAFIDDIDDLVSNGQILKAGNSSTVAHVSYAGQELVIKRYNIKNFWHFLSRCYRPSRAAVSWRNGNLLQLLGVATPRPLGFIENRFGLFRKTAYLICERSSGQELTSVFRDRAPLENELSQLRDIFEIFKEYKISHGDMKATNLLLTKDGKIELLDLDTMQEHKCSRSFNSAFDKDKHRFIKNWQDAKIKDLFEALFF